MTTVSTTEEMTTASHRMTDARLASLRQIEQEVSVMLRRVKRTVGVRAQLVHPELPGVAYVMLGHVADHGPVRASSLVEAMSLDKGAVSRHLQHLEELGLITRTPDPADGRATLVAVTDDAVRRLASVADQRRVIFDERLAQWDDEDLSGFAAQMRRYNAALEE